jgi:V/A-type H+/Na+-transporting ATPase subunit D
MSAERLAIHPTRLELLALKKRKDLAEAIGDILQKDLETLILALIEYRKKAKLFRTQMLEALDSAYSQFIEVEMLLGPIKTKEISLSTSSLESSIQVSTIPGVLGIPFPTLEHKRKEGTHEIRFNPIETPMQLEDATSKMEAAVDSISKLAELTAVIRAILEMTALKRRQVNRIKFKIVPQIDSTIRYVELILEEIERQDAIRVRVLQRKRKERTTKSS